MRYFLELAYQGGAYHGWQRQPNAITVQEVLERALSTLLRINITVVGAGRTDAGVHAKQLFVHFETPTIEATDHLVHRLNAFLPQDIAVTQIAPVHANVHARFDAVSRTYEYLVVTTKNPFYKDSAHLVPLPLDIPQMTTAASLLMDYQDFKCFSKAHSDVKTYLCDITHAEWTNTGDLLRFTITADRFLRNMVRAIVGTLLEIGLGKRSVAEMKSIIESRDRSRAGVSVPAKGLYLTRVTYPDNIYL
ncbi:MAG: tRNA pseudouridine(38-40) synthase TruA [Bacteroidota bacterium]